MESGLGTGFGLGRLSAHRWLRHKTLLRSRPMAFEQALHHASPVCGAKARSRPGKPSAQCPMPNAQCPMPHAQCPMPHAQCPMPNAQCPMPSAQYAHGAKTVHDAPSCPAFHARAARRRPVRGITSSCVTAAARGLYMSAQPPTLLLGRLPSGRRRRRAESQKLGAGRRPAAGDLVTQSPGNLVIRRARRAARRGALRTGHVLTAEWREAAGVRHSA